MHGVSAATVTAMPRKRSVRQAVSQRNFVRERRRAKGWTQVDLSARSGVSQSVISDFENQRGWMEWDNLAKLAEALGCEFLELFVDPEDPDLNAMAAHATKDQRRRLALAVRALISKE